MPIYRTALCEDEKAVREELAAECRDIFAAWGVAATVDAFGSADALASELAGGKEWDLYLLDIQMEGTDGLSFARRLYDNGVRDRVVFITGSAEYALAGYSAHPLHYLLKPVRREELEGALRMALEKRRPSALLFRSGGRITALPTEEVMYLESRNHGVVVHLEGSELSFASPLVEAEKQTPPEAFARCHKSYLVNLAWVSEVGRTELKLRGGERLPVSRACYAPFQSALVRYLNK